MLIFDINTIRYKINDYSKKGLPYLFIINFDKTEGYFIDNPLEQQEIYFQVNGVGNKPNKEEYQSTHKIDHHIAHQQPNKILNRPYHNNYTLSSSPISTQEYKSKFDIIYQGILYGNSFLTNLTIKTPIQSNLSLYEIFLLANAKYQIFVPNQFVCFSPECFVRISNGIISTYPMKGTIDADIPNAHQLILNDYKEIAEHNTIVDLLRNDLSIHAIKVQVEKFRYIEKIHTKHKNILQVSSRIIGTLPGDYQSRIGDIIMSMLPAGSISGAPKISTLHLIKMAEKESRGYYTGVFGYYDGKHLDTAVMIRFMEEQNGEKFFRSGSGITAFSDWQKEYDEVLDKIYLT